MTNDDMDEIARLKSIIEEQEIVIKNTKGFAFGLESKNVKYLQRIDQLKGEVQDLKKEVEMYESSTSWKITKPLRWITGIFR